IDGFVLKPFNVKTLAAVVGERIEAARALADAGGVEEGTELLTPALLTTRLTDEIHHAQVSGDPLTFGLVTLRTLTGLPGQAGQDAAGWLIREIAAQARTMLPEEFAMARSGNDELAVVAPTALPLQAARVLEHVLDELRGPRTLPGGESVQVEPVAGLAGYPQHAGDADGLFMAADAALSDAIDTRRPVAVAL
ncbi:MAG TPA: diguanylate cyclase, partial [Acidimicrobiales bacterium]|nr:diguanylate cyclase [Acidimicrobiales bacterium]